MIPGEFTDFFVASAGASAALIGLLFVAVSIAPERIFESGGRSGKAAVAVNAFVALVNAFTISLTALIPRDDLGVVSLAVGVFSIITLVRRDRSSDEPRVGGAGGSARRASIPFAGLLVYVVQVGNAIVLMRRPGESGPVHVLAVLLILLYGRALALAWKLLQGRELGSSSAPPLTPLADDQGLDA